MLTRDTTLGAPATPRLSTPEPYDVPRWDDEPQFSDYYTPPAPAAIAPTPVMAPTPSLSLPTLDINAIVPQMVAARQATNQAEKQAAMNTSIAEKVLAMGGGAMGASSYGIRGGTGQESQRGKSPYGFQPKMWSALQRAFSDMKSAGLGTPGITDGFRSYAQQVDVKRRKGRLAATPGRSVHGIGYAADLSLDAKQQAWLEKNGARYGLRRLPSESWHWQLDPRMRS